MTDGPLKPDCVRAWRRDSEVMGRTDSAEGSRSPVRRASAATGPGAGGESLTICLATLLALFPQVHEKMDFCMSPNRDMKYCGVKKTPQPDWTARRPFYPVAGGHKPLADTPLSGGMVRQPWRGFLGGGLSHGPPEGTERTGWTANWNRCSTSRAIW